MNVIDLFCGCGGFSLGARNAGFNVITAYDIDKTLTSAYTKNFPKSKLILKDITKLTKEEIIENAQDSIDGIFGGPPCQGFSEIGRRDKEDPRRLLLLEFFKIVKQISPKFFVMENVKGLLKNDSQKLLDQGLSTITDSYEIYGPKLLNASEFGAATSRPRVFVIGFRKDLNIKFGDQDLAKMMTPPATVADAISDLMDIEPSNSSDSPDQWIIKSKNINPYNSRLKSADSSFTGNKRTKHLQATVKRYLTVEPGSTDPIGRHHRLMWNGLCPTLRAGTGTDKGSFQAVRPLHPDQPRVITVREAARLQGFPDSHIFHETIWHSFRMIGNSVSPIIAQAIFTAIREKFPTPKSINRRIK